MTSPAASSPRATMRIAAFSRAVFSKIDILVNNAGVLGDGQIGMINDETIDRTIDINLKGAIYNLRSASRLMRRKKTGSIVNVSSIIGTRGNSGQLVYAASKSGILGMTFSAAKELAPDNIRVNAIAPGFIDTDMTRALGDDLRNAMLSQVPAGRLGSPEEIAAAVVFLASDSAAYITGETLHINGGMYMT